MDNLYNNYIYAIAQGRTLAYINSLKQGAADARAELQSLADSVGARLELGYASASFIFNHDAAVPQGWKDLGQRGRIQIPPPPPRYRPDEDTDDGLAIAQKINAATEKMSLTSLFKTACGKSAPCGSYNNHEFSFEEFGGVIVVKCPIVNYDHNKDISRYFLPPDCQQIDFSVYAALKVATFKDKQRDIQPFAKNFE